MKRVLLAAVLLAGCGRDDTSGFHGTFDPISRVYLNFGQMTVTGTEVSWEQGQRSSFTVERIDEDTCLLRLDKKPVLHGRPHTHLYLRRRYRGKLFVDATFFESARDVSNDRIAMWGAYVVNE